MTALKRPFDKYSESPDKKESFSSPNKQKQSSKEKELFSRSTKTSEETNIVKETKAHLKIDWFLMLPLECRAVSVMFIWGKIVYRDTEKQSSNIQETEYICVDNKEMYLHGSKESERDEISHACANMVLCRKYSSNKYWKTVLHELHWNLFGKWTETWTLRSLGNCHHWPLFPEPFLLRDDTIGEIRVLKYETTALCK